MPVPFSPFHLRLPPMGPTLEAENPGDGLIWNGTGWTTGPIGGGGVLAGDTNGPAGANETNSLTGTGGGANVALADMSSDPAEDSVVVRGPAGGDYRTVPLSSLPFTAPTEFDHLISTRDDLAAVVAPVGGEFILPSGSYFFKEEVDLNDGERVVVDAEDVFLMGGGVEQLRGFNGNFASSEPALIVRNGATCTLWNMRIGAAQIARHGILLQGSTSDLVCFNSSIPTSTGGSQPALEVQDGNVFALRTTFGGALAAVEITGGSFWEFTDCSLVAGLGGNGLDVNIGAQDAALHLNRCTLRGSAPTNSGAMDLVGANLDFYSVDSSYEGPAPSGQVIGLGDLSSVNMTGGIVFATGGVAIDGISVAGNVGGGLQFIGVQGEFLDDFIIRVGGVQNRCVVNSCDTAGDVAVGVDWQTANIPTNGLLEVGNQFNTLSPWQNHNQFDARVNRKCNSLQGGLASETAIVP